jgi:hypothetical protein
MPATFDQHGLRFEYPDNWSVEQGEDFDAEQQVVVSSPHTAFWQLSKHPSGTELEPLFDEVLSALRSEYQDIEVDPADEVIEGHLVTGFSVNFFCLDLTNTCWVRGFETPEANYLLMCQAEDREFEHVELVFRAMLSSVLRNLNDARPAEDE